MDEQTATANGNELLHLVEQMKDEGIEPAELFADMAIQAYEEYTGTGKLDSINKAVSMAGYPPKHTAKVSNFGIERSRRYEQTVDTADLEGAIQAAQQAVDFTPQDHPDRAGRLNNLGNKLGRRYEQTGDIADLETAIEAA